MNIPTYDLETMAREIILACELPPGCKGTLQAALRDAYEMGRDRISYGALQEVQRKQDEAWRKQWPGGLEI